MPEFILPEEVDRCPHCDAVLRDPPACCEAMQQEHSDQMHREYGPVEPQLVEEMDDSGYWDDGDYEE